MKRFYVTFFMCLAMALSSYADVNYLCFSADEDNSTIKLDDKWKVGEQFTIMETSTDGINWKKYKLGKVIRLSKAGDRVYFRGDYCGALEKYNSFVITGKIAASGDIMTLTDYDHPSTSLAGKPWAFNCLFRGCDNLTTAPELPATTLSEHCYSLMFFDCTSLALAPDLPATTLAEGCYSSMFFGCSLLTEAPVLPAKTLVKDCYVSMFNSCDMINHVKVGFTQWNPQDTEVWMNMVAKDGIFECPASLETKSGDNFYPEGWTRVNVQ